MSERRVRERERERRGEGRRVKLYYYYWAYCRTGEFQSKIVVDKTFTNGGY